MFANSDVGVIPLNKDTAGAHFYRAAGVDGFRSFRNLNANALLARTVFRPNGSSAQADVTPHCRPALMWHDTRSDVRTAYADIGPLLNDEMGFVPRIGIRKEEAQLGVICDPIDQPVAPRDHPHWLVSNVTRSSGGLFQSRAYRLSLAFFVSNSASLEFGVNSSIESISSSRS